MGSESGVRIVRYCAVDKSLNRHLPYGSSRWNHLYDLIGPAEQDSASSNRHDLCANLAFKRRWIDEGYLKEERDEAKC